MTRQVINSVKIISAAINEFGKRYYGLAIAIAIISGISSPISTLLVRALINNIQLHVIWRKVLISVGGYIIYGGGVALIIKLLDYYLYKYKIGFNLEIEQKVLKKMERIPLSSYEKSSTYDLINRAEYELDGKLLVFMDGIVATVANIIAIIIYLSIISRFKIWLIFFVAILPIVRFTLQSNINKLNFKNQINRTNDARKCWYIKYLFSYGNGYKELKINNLYKLFTNRNRSIREMFNKQDKSVKRMELKGMVILDIVENILDALIIFALIFEGYIGDILIGDVITYIQAIMQIKTQMTSMLTEISSLTQDSLYIEQFERFLSLEEETTTGIKIDNIQEINVNDLSFKYAGTDDKVLKNIDITLHKGETVAIIGANGSGKTTLIKLLLGFYDNYQGNIKVNGLNLSEIDVESYRSHISVLLQDYVKFEDSLRNNILFGKNDCHLNDEELENVCKQVKLDDLVPYLNAGFDTQLGSWFDNGIQLSAGQWQKLALGRSLIRDSDLYIFDEPNADLDPIASDQISKLIFSVCRDKIGIIVLHKFPQYIKEIDRIIVMSNSEISAIGKHDELLKSSILYKQMYEVQRI